MKRIRSIVFFITLICLIQTTEVCAAEESNTLNDFNVYVLLEQKEAIAGKLWKIKSKTGFFISDPFDSEEQETIKNSGLLISQHEDDLYVNGKKLAVDCLKIEKIGFDDLVINDKTYTGFLLLIFKNNSWHLINGVGLEDYVCSVLRSESWPGWPLEVNKAFAIVQRSYVVSQLLRARGKKKIGRGFLYDVGCTNKHQTYNGSHNCEILRQAVNETAGIVLAHNRRPIIAMYDTCCGGIIPSKISGVNFTDEPYLARSYPCTACADCKVFSWKATYTIDEVEAIIKAENKSIKKVQHIKVSKRDLAGLVKEIKVKSHKKVVSFTGKKAYSLFKDIKSFCFSASRSGNQIIFSGTGYGHHLGMCQWGARQKIKEGLPYTEVLKFYYPGTTFMKLEVA